MIKRKVLQIQKIIDGASTTEIDEVLASGLGKVGIINGQPVMFSLVEVDVQGDSAQQHQISPGETFKTQV